MPYRMLASVSLSALIMSGCATQRAMTDAEWNHSLTRDFSGATRQQVIEAARRVLSGADPDDFRFSPTEDGIQATREWTWFLLIAATRGLDTWTVTAKETASGTSARVHLSVVTSDVNGAYMGGAPVPISSMSQTPAFDGTAVYDLFWSRVEYLLGIRDDWMTCATAQDRAKAGFTWGATEPLCDSLTTSDPPAPSRISAK